MCNISGILPQSLGLKGKKEVMAVGFAPRLHCKILIVFVLFFFPWPLPQAEGLGHFATHSERHSVFHKQTRTDMSAIVYKNNSTKSSDSRHKETCCQDIATVCISNSQCLGFSGSWVSAVSAIVQNILSRN